MSTEYLVFWVWLDKWLLTDAVCGTDVLHSCVFLFVIIHTGEYTMLIKCTQCGTKTDASNQLFKILLGVVSIVLYMTALAMFADVPIFGLMFLVPAILVNTMAVSHKLPKCKRCGGHTIPQD